MIKTGGDVTGCPSRPPVHRFLVQKRNALAAGFTAVIGLLAFAMFYAYRVQGSLSDQAVGIYHKHVQRDDALWRLRRTLWLGANLARDYLVHPGPATADEFRSRLAVLRQESRDLVEALDKLVPSVEPNGELQQSINEFWKVVAGIPDATRPLDAPQRYAYIQTEIVPRRNATGDLVRDFAIADQKSLAESELAFARTRRASAQRLMATLGFTLLAGLVVALFSLTYASGLERKATAQYEEVERAKRELQQLSAQLMNIQEEERMRLSRELHDEVGQMIATARLEILRAETLLSDSTGDARARLSRARELTGRTMEAIRDICVLLRPALLDDLGLSPALQWQVEDFTVRTGIPCELTESALDDPELPDAVKTCVYRVLQEALHNCEKHSRATLVTVRVGRADDVLQLSIEDNGAGLPLANEAPAPVAHLGLLGMRERATQLGGNVAIASSPGKGTRLTLMLPLKPVTSAAATAGGRV